MRNRFQLRRDRIKALTQIKSNYNSPVNVVVLFNNYWFVIRILCRLGSSLGGLKTVIEMSM